ncbi:spore protease YyaC [Clostridium sp. MSJ-4]|uniref:Spore protease YyaC n=1 Tax=Clostridium simiarum TaxID=2841506 RepID=A0ABS6F1L7_9CLOT|nr:spore protease YyaC [Clostridium simiarum]MBU5592399.1 spore protease YyaC [Clostridium simiarum]
MKKKLTFDSNDRGSVALIRDALSEIISEEIKKDKPIIFLCIGTDRSTGDSLGPLIGHKLKFLMRNNISIYGNLEHPIHAKNLEETINEINESFPNSFIIAIDACLGNLQNVGKIFINKSPLYPGAAMNKKLPPVGDISITGVVNISGALEFMVLQNTRLYTVMQLADIISKGIYHSILKSIGGKNSSQIKSSNLIENN